MGTSQLEVESSREMSANKREQALKNLEDEIKAYQTQVEALTKEKQTLGR